METNVEENFAFLETFPHLKNASRLGFEDKIENEDL